ncbi:MAG TPA: DsrE family protein [Nitrospirales bacterium]|nr:DsrE family protein [Nitrospirales bacterium]
MPNFIPKPFLMLSALVFACVYGLVLSPGLVLADKTPNQDKVKVLYHLDSNDPALAKYAMALINKHIEAEGGPDKIDLVLVVHGPALKLFESDTVDQELKDKLKAVIDKGIKAEMCQVSMKLYGTPLEKLVAGFTPTEHPVAVKRIADLQRAGYVYIKP